MADDAFPVKLCNKCHVNPGVSRNGRCKACHAQEMRELRRRQKEKIERWRKSYYSHDAIMARLYEARTRRKKYRKGDAK